MFELDKSININDFCNKYGGRIKFPAGEVGFNFEKKHMEYLSANKSWVFRVQNNDDLMFISMLADRVLDFSGGDKIQLLLPYLPYSRDDKKEREGSSYGINHLVKILNNSAAIFTFDPHCDISTFYDVHAIAPEVSIKFHIPMHEYDFIVYADKSAQRTRKFLEDCGVPIGHLQCLQALKDRDPDTGALSNFRLDEDSKKHIYASPPKVDKYKVLVIDDICDGGGTFIPLADNLRSAFGEIGEDILIDLYVTHGIFSRGLDDIKGSYLNPNYDAVYAFYDYNKYAASTEKDKFEISSKLSFSVPTWKPDVTYLFDV
jgi:ribose-phosphate pyrophosphokinase